MIRCAITGGIACGKSLVGSFLRELGCAVCDTDGIGHDLLQAGQPVRDAVVRAFGPDILDDADGIDRRRLGQRVFNDAAALQTLNQLMHPEIRRRWQSWLRSQPASALAAAVQIPLFFEVAEPRNEWDLVICVFAGDAVCRLRLRQRGWTVRDIEARRRAQWPVIEKMRRADVVLDNNGSPAWLRRQTDLFYRQRIQLET